MAVPLGKMLVSYYPPAGRNRDTEFYRIAFVKEIHCPGHYPVVWTLEKIFAVKT